MSWIAVLLIGVAVTDLAHSIRPVKVVNECIGAAAAVWVGLLARAHRSGDLLALAVIAGRRRALGPDRHSRSRTRSRLAAAARPRCRPGRGRCWPPAPRAAAGGLLGEWLDGVQVPLLHGLTRPSVRWCCWGCSWSS